jgi:hypothetical protein
VATLDHLDVESSGIQGLPCPRSGCSPKANNGFCQKSPSSPPIDRASTGGHGLAIATSPAAASAVIGLGTLIPRPQPFLIAGAALSMTIWAFGQAFGGVLTGQATDPNAGPLFALLAMALLAHPRSPSQCESADQSPSSSTLRMPGEASRRATPPCRAGLSRSPTATGFPAPYAGRSRADVRRRTPA